jgi:hypothetical protein
MSTFDSDIKPLTKKELDKITLTPKDLLHYSKDDEIKRKKAEEGPKLEVDLQNIKVYNIFTEEAAKYYGNGTRWCTVADNNNMFSYYKKQGNIYIGGGIYETYILFLYTSYFI